MSCRPGGGIFIIESGGPAQRRSRNGGGTGLYAAAHRKNGPAAAAAHHLKPLAGTGSRRQPPAPGQGPLMCWDATWVPAPAHQVPHAPSRPLLSNTCPVARRCSHWVRLRHPARPIRRETGFPDRGGAPRRWRSELNTRPHTERSRRRIFGVIGSTALHWECNPSGATQTNHDTQFDEAPWRVVEAGGKSPPSIVNRSDAFGSPAHPRLPAPDS
jgi:hypothetical protein